MESLVNEALEFRLATINFVASPFYKKWVDEVVHIPPYDLDIKSTQMSLEQKDTLKVLLNGETYAVNQMCGDLIFEAQKTLPETTLVPELLPGPAGFLWFEKGFPISDAADRGERFIGISWMPCGAVAADGERHEGVVLEPWFYTPGLDNRYVLTPGGTRPWFWGTDTTKANAIDVAEKTAVDNIFFSFCLFVKQRILSQEQQRASRGIRRRIENQPVMHVEPLVNVIQLRARESHYTPSGEHHEVDWQWQWLVRGHWRQQWYPSRQVREPKWISGYVKGPEGKPLKHGSGARAFAVVR